MHIISRKRLLASSQRHADAAEALDQWYRSAKAAPWQHLEEVKLQFPKAEAVGSFTIFNIKGNKYRLVVSLDYEAQVIYIKYVLTHAEYDKDEWKHDPTIDPDVYGRLLAQYQPQPITTEEENERALATVERLLALPERLPETSALITVWATLIEQFEEEHYLLPTTKGTPAQMLRFLMDQHDLKQSDLVGLLGSSGVVSEIVNGKRSISKAQAKALAERFHVSPALFL